MIGRVTTVAFGPDTLFATERADGVFVAVSPIARALGLDAKRQRERIQRDPILSEGGAVMALPSTGGEQETFCLRVDLINGWLFTIDESRVKAESRDKVLHYKRECYGVLFRHFYGQAQRPELIEPPRVTEEAEAPRVRLVTEARLTFGAAAAGQLWFSLGLPVVPAMYRDGGQGEFRYPLVPAAPATA